MLCLTRKVGERILLFTTDGVITIALGSAHPKKAKLAIDAPKQVVVVRADLLDEKAVQEQADLALARAVDVDLATLAKLLDRSGLDMSPCRLCGKPVICIPDGIPMCVTCAKQEAEGQ